MGIEDDSGGEEAGDSTLGLELALQRARAGGKDAIADALLAKQTEKLEHELHHLKLRTLNEWFSLLLKGLGALVALAVVAAIAAMAWGASRSHALIVEQFQSAPDLAAKGMDGASLAAQVLDRLEEMRNHTKGVREATAFSAEPASEAKLEIPDTGISLGELRHMLQDWLGHDLRISGALSHDGDQLALTVRTGTVAERFKGAPDDLDGLVGKAAEAVYAATQPLTFVDYLMDNHRLDEAMALARREAAKGTRADRAWAFTQLGRILRERQDYEGSRQAFEEATALNPRLWLAWNDLANIQEFALGDEETALASRKRAAGADDFGGADPVSTRHFHVSDQTYVDEAVGDYAAALAINAREADEQTDPDLAYQSGYLSAYEAAYLHDIAMSCFWMQHAKDRAFAVENSAPLHEAGVVADAVTYWQLVSVDDWAGAARAMDNVNRVNDKAAPNGAISSDGAYWYALSAIAWARAGQPQTAKAITDKLPARCNFCLLSRGWQAQTAGDRKAADGYFAEAVRRYPSEVRPLEYWGMVRLLRGDTKGAIALFSKAHDIGPRFPDALEGWGEALIREGDCESAVKKFSAAAVYAPHWGRNQLLWGQCLARLGRNGDAAEHFAQARGLALSAADRKSLPPI